MPRFPAVHPFKPPVWKPVTRAIVFNRRVRLSLVPPAPCPTRLHYGVRHGQ